MKRIVVIVDDSRRIICHPREGGCHVEEKVPGVGWVLADGALTTRELRRAFTQLADYAYEKVDQLEDILQAER